MLQPVAWRGLAAAVACAMVLLAGCGGAPRARLGAAPDLPAAERVGAVQSFDHVWTTVRDKHWDPTLHGLDWEAVRDSLRPRVESARTRDEARAAMQAMLATLGQTHFAVFSHETWRDLGTARGGEGSPGFDVRVLDGQAIVTSITAGSPADSLGVKPGWEVVNAGDEELRPVLAAVLAQFAGKSVADHMVAAAARARLSGPIGSEIHVRFRDGEDRVVPLTVPLVSPPGRRAVLGTLPPFYARLESRRLDGDMGYILVSGFFDPAGVMPAFGTAMTEFMNAPGVVIDLRGNPGGIGIMAMGMAGWLIAEEGTVMGRMITRDSQLEFAISPRPTTYTGKVAVLIDGLSASTAEIMAAGLRDLERARLFGTRTAGAALASLVEQLPNGDGFQYAVADYISEGGQPLEGQGVAPDVETPPTRTDLLNGRDNALAAAVAWILGDE